MATKIHMEALSPTMEEGQLVRWLKNEGEQISEGDVLAEIETDKATMELVARGEGVLRKQFIAEGETAPVGSVIGVIAAEDEDIPEILAEAPAGAGAPTHEAPTEAPTVAAGEGAPGQRDVGEAAGGLAASDKTEREQYATGMQAAVESPDRRATPAVGTSQERAAGRPCRGACHAARERPDQGLAAGASTGRGGRASSSASDPGHRPRRPDHEARHRGRARRAPPAGGARRRAAPAAAMPRRRATRSRRSRTRRCGRRSRGVWPNRSARSRPSTSPSRWT